MPLNIYHLRCLLLLGTLWARPRRLHFERLYLWLDDIKPLYQLSKVQRCCCRGRFSTRVLWKRFCCLTAVYVFGWITCFSAACLYIWLSRLCLRCVCIILVLHCLFWSTFLRGNCQTDGGVFLSCFVYVEVFTSHQSSNIYLFIFDVSILFLWLQPKVDHLKKTMTTTLMHY